MKIDFTDPQIRVAISFILFFIFWKINLEKLTGFLEAKIIEIKTD